MITGANSGIGKATAIALGKMGFKIVMICKNYDSGKKAQEEIINLTKNKDIDLLQCDLSSQTQIRKLVNEFKEKYQTLDVLINNAGIVLSKRAESVDGVEMNFAVNYLAPFLLTNLLLDILIKSAPSRIINISSEVHRNAKLDFEDLQSNKSYGAFKTYGRSKLALLLFTYELSRKLAGKEVTVNAVHPGVVKSNLGRDQPYLSQLFTKIFFKSPEKGAETSIYLASSSDVKDITGKYFANKQLKQSSEESYNLDYAKKLWDISVKMTGLDTN
jgi:NAD(P)-dependent dehydrogenase (short-subunit alcohol dehydrogenase family)